MNTIRRNVAVAIGNSGDRATIPALIGGLHLQHTETRAAVPWALGRLGGTAAKEALGKALREEEEKEVPEEIQEALRTVS